MKTCRGIVGWLTPTRIRLPTDQPRAEHSPPARLCQPQERREAGRKVSPQTENRERLNRAAHFPVDAVKPPLSFLSESCINFSTY